MKIREDLIVREVVSEHVVLFPSDKNDRSTRMLSLNTTSNYLWQTLQGKEFELEDVTEALCSNYEVEREVAAADAARWVNQMKEAGAIL